MPLSRRDILTTAATGGAVAVLNGLVPRSTRALTPRVRSAMPSTLDSLIVIDSTDVRALATRALDAAKSAGASYADVRLTRVLTQSFDGGGWVGRSGFLSENERLAVGVRALIRGTWGFAASPYWDADDVVALARSAAEQARANARVHAIAAPAWEGIPVASGAWKTPITIDPFLVTPEEKSDFLESWCSRARRYHTGPNIYAEYAASFQREERAIATTDGAYFTQTVYQSGGGFTVSRDTFEPGQPMARASAPGFDTVGAGWELFTEADIPGQIPDLYAAADPHANQLRARAGDIGRYDVVIDAPTMAAMLAQTLGPATQLDRAIGYEANAAGTSYLGPDPLAFLGTFQAAAPVVTVSADRTMPRGLATVKWDDEGVEPQPFTLVRGGTLVDYQTTRDQVALLAPYYQKAGMPVRSHGCAAAQDAMFITTQHTPNLTLEPGLPDVQFNDFVADTKRGFAVMGGSVATDFQRRTGVGDAVLREIVNGRLGPVVRGLGFVFDATQFWKNIVAVGGKNSVIQVSQGDSKGQPNQARSYSVRAVPAKVVNVDFVNPRRR